MRIKHLITHYPLFSFFILSYALLWSGAALFASGMLPLFGIWPLTLDGREVVKVQLWRTLLVWTPNFAAMIVLGVTSGARGIRDLFAKFLLWRVGIRWWLISFLLPLSLAGGSVWLYALSGGELNLSMVRYLPGIFSLHCLYSITGSGFGEEAGWRGFALPRLQLRFGALVASVIVGLLWGFWHAPIWFVERTTIMFVVNFLVMIVSLSIIYTWIYNQSRGSLLMIAIIHNTGLSIDATLSLSFAAVLSNQAIGDAFNVLLLIFVILLILITKGTLGYRQI